MHVLGVTTTALQKQPQLTEALTRAFMFADASVADEIHLVGIKLTAMITHAIDGTDEAREPTDRGHGDRPGHRRRVAVGPHGLGHRPYVRG